MPELDVRYSDDRTRAEYAKRVEHILAALGEDKVSFLHKKQWRVSILSAEDAHLSTNLEKADSGCCNIAKRQIEIPVERMSDDSPRFLVPFQNDFEMNLVHELFHPLLWEAKFNSTRAMSEFLYAAKLAHQKALEIAPEEMRAIDRAYATLPDPTILGNHVDSSALANLPDFADRSEKKRLAILVGTLCNTKYYSSAGYTPKQYVAEMAANLYSLSQKYKDDDVREIAGGFLLMADEWIANLFSRKKGPGAGSGFR